MSDQAIGGSTQAWDVRAVHRSRAAVEWPTAALTVAIYGGWLALTLAWQSLPVWVLVAGGAWFIAWQSSLQHEILHGHPTRSRRVNRLLGIVPLSLWIPYERYRRSHLLHHVDERLTDPFDDPESYYWEPGAWEALGPVGRFLVRAQTTLLGRLVIGPAWTVWQFLRAEVAAVRAGDREARRVWAEHLLWCIPVVLWVTVVCGMPLWLYILAFVYPGTSLMLVRSFAEHRAAEGVAERTAIVENAWILGPLFLFNNLHAVHHEAPTVPWYRIPAWYAANRERLVRENGGLVYDGYLDVARRFLLRSHDGAVHPFGRVKRGA